MHSSLRVFSIFAMFLVICNHASSSSSSDSFDDTDGDGTSEPAQCPCDFYYSKIAPRCTSAPDCFLYVDIFEGVRVTELDCGEDEFGVIEDFECLEEGENENQSSLAPNTNETSVCEEDLQSVAQQLNCYLCDGPLSDESPFDFDNQYNMNCGDTVEATWYPPDYEAYFVFPLLPVYCQTEYDLTFDVYYPDNGNSETFGFNGIESNWTNLRYYCPSCWPQPDIRLSMTLTCTAYDVLA